MAMQNLTNEQTPLFRTGHELPFSVFHYSNIHLLFWTRDDWGYFIERTKVPRILWSCCMTSKVVLEG